MPFTPYHMGPGIAVKSIWPEKVSLMVYGWSQIVMDIEPLIQISRGAENWHGLTHNLAGAAILGAVAAVSGKYLVEWGLCLLSLGKKQVKIGWKAAMLSGWIGSFGHVLVDGFLHHDMQPFWPILPGNPMLVFGASWLQVEIFCLVSGAVGAVVYFLTKFLKTRRKRLESVPEE